MSYKHINVHTPHSSLYTPTQLLQQSHKWLSHKWSLYFNIILLLFHFSLILSSWSSTHFIFSITTLGSYLHQLPQTYYDDKIGQVMLKFALFQILLTSFKLSDYNGHEHSTPLFENLSDCTDYEKPKLLNTGYKTVQFNSPANVSSPGFSTSSCILLNT